MTQATAIEQGSVTLNVLLAKAKECATPSFLGNKLGDYWTTLHALPDSSLQVQVKCTPDLTTPTHYVRGSYNGIICEIVTHRGQILAHESIWEIIEPETTVGSDWQQYEQYLAEIVHSQIDELNQPNIIRHLLANEIHTLAQTLQALQ